MKVQLNGQQYEYLKLKLSKVADSDFIGQAVIKALDEAKAHEDMIEQCPYEKGMYEGKKQCCSICGYQHEAGDFEEWSLET